MPIIKDDVLVTDSWVVLGDDEPLPGAASAIVSLERWQAEREALVRRNAPLGIRLRSDQAPEGIADDLDHFAVVALEFPKFTDGRAYSYARLLRDRHGYRGELRALGNVLRDQYPFMRRCGFDAVQVAEGAELAPWLESLAAIGVWYQAAGDRHRPAPLLRQDDPGQLSSTGAR